MSPFKLAWLNLKRNPLISLLLVFSMGLALGTVGLLYRIESLQSQRWSQISTWAPIVVGPKQGGLDLLLSTSLLEVRNLELIPYKLFATIRAKQDVEFEDKSKVSNQQVELAVPLLFMAQYLGHWIVGTDTSIIELLRKQNLAELQSGNWFQNEREIVIGAKMAERLNKTVGDGLEIDLLDPNGQPISQSAQVKISGILRPTETAWDDAAFGDLKLGWLVYSKLELKQISVWGNEVLHYFWLVSPFESMKGLRNLINQRSVAQLAFINEEKTHLESLLGQTKELSLMISGLILLICFIVILALMTFRFQNQSGQIATLQAIGFSQPKLLSWFALEASYMLVASLLIAGLFTQFFWWLTSSMMEDSVTFLSHGWIQPRLEWPVWLCGCLAFLVSLLAPWLSLLKKDIHQTLRA